MSWIRLEPEVARDVLDALRLLEGRLRGSGRRLSLGAEDLRRSAEQSLVACGGQSSTELANEPHDAFVPLLWSFEETSEALKASESTVRRLVRTGALPAVRFDRVLRFDPSDVRTLIDRSKEIA